MSSGRVVGGVPLTNGPLGHLLRNRVYLGEINHHRQSHPGEHEPIVDLELFDAVQRRLDANHAEKRASRASSGALLMGRIFDDPGNRMTPSFAVKNGVRYRYYVSCVLAQGRKDEAGSVRRVPTADIESAVVQALRSDLGAAAGLDVADVVQHQLERVVVRNEALELSVLAESDTPGFIVSVPWAATPTIRKRSVIAPASVPSDVGPIRAEARARLLEAIARAKGWLVEMVSGAETTIDIARREGVSDRSVRMTLSLALLAPAVVRAAVCGELHAGYGMSVFADAPPDWRAQLESIAPRVTDQ